MTMSLTENSITRQDYCLLCKQHEKTGMMYVGRELISVTQQKLLLPTKFPSEKKSDRESFSISATSGKKLEYFKI